jgi:hypothetical protein
MDRRNNKPVKVGCLVAACLAVVVPSVSIIIAYESQLWSLKRLEGRLKSKIGPAGVWNEYDWPSGFNSDFIFVDGGWNSRVYVQATVIDLGRAYYIRVRAERVDSSIRVQWKRESFIAYGDWPRYNRQFLQ